MWPANQKPYLIVKTINEEPTKMADPDF